MLNTGDLGFASGFEGRQASAGLLESAGYAPSPLFFMFLGQANAKNTQKKPRAGLGPNLGYTENIVLRDSVSYVAYPKKCRMFGRDPEYL